MWRHETVERALLRWKNWRQTIVRQWIILDGESLSVLESEARGQLQSLDFPESYPLEIYWISAVVSDVCLNDESAFTRIVVPAGLCAKYRQWLAYYGLSPGNRFLPPPVWSEKDILRFSEQTGIPPDRLCYQPKASYLYLPPGHEFYSVLGGLRGRPKKGTVRRGRHPVFPDRLAVKCACKRPHMTYVEIARELGLPRHKYYFSEQSDTARHLVARGQKLIEEVGLAP